MMLKIIVYFWKVIVNLFIRLETGKYKKWIIYFAFPIWTL